MKKLFTIFVFIMSLAVTSQTLTRIEVKGNIIVEGSDIGGITVYNATSKQGTITNDKGEFKIKVALNDNIEVSSLQYENISFLVNEAIIKSKTIKLFLIEEINKLDEIVVLKKTLSGNLKTDIAEAKTFRPKLDALYFGVKNNTANLSKDALSDVKNISVDANRPLVYGLNIVNVVDQLLLPLFRSEVPNKKKAGVPEVPVEAIKYYFGSEFLADNFNIPKHRVEEFIRYVERDNFDFSLLNYGKELEFLELLNKKSKAFLTKD